MTKKQLKIDISFDYILAGIVSSENAYKICWMINEITRWNLSKEEDIVIPIPKFRNLQHFELYCFYINENKVRLFSNKNEETIFMAELLKMDYLLQLTGVFMQKADELVQKLREKDNITGVYIINPEKLKQSNRLLI